VSDAAASLYRLIVEVRASFSRLRQFADAMHADLSVTASMRAVMEAVAEQGAQPVPRIARAKGVSRQHIQVNVDALRARGLVEAHENPGHKRSTLVALTPKGRNLFEEIRRRERAALEALVGGLRVEEIEAGARALSALRQRLEQAESGGIEHE
jgi:DNA-binding MarR family transcriptional regulator